MASKAILMDVRDDVATALVPLEVGDEVEVELEGRAVRVVARDGIPFGHKIALCDIAQGEEVLKYGLPIGKALQKVRAGEWVHVHNCRSDRFGHRHQKYGVNA